MFNQGVCMKAVVFLTASWAHSGGPLASALRPTAAARLGKGRLGVGTTRG
jgi:hypothetical protein